MNILYINNSDKSMEVLMKTQKNILIAFLLNLSFSIFEFIGGLFTGSVAILSDSIHDIGDALSIGLSYFLEKKSKRQPNSTYTYGYARFSVLGSFITTMILICGSFTVIVTAVKKFINPTEINYNGMIIFAVIGVMVNFLAAYFTREGDSLNQKAVNLHMLEDVLGWAVVLVGAIIMKFTDFSYIDPILSICVAVFILINSAKSLKEILDLFLVKVPHNISVEKVKEHITELDEVVDVHHIHLWSSDGNSVYATMHIVSDSDSVELKKRVKDELAHLHISHSTLELEKPNESCDSLECKVEHSHSHSHAHSHHHHH